MIEAGPSAADAAPHDAAALQARIAAVRAVAARIDPVRLGYLEALAARIAVQAGAVRELLCEKLAAALAECERRCAAAPVSPHGRARAVECGPLAELNRHIRASAPRANAGDHGHAAASDELRSVRRFRRAWLGSRTQEQVQQAIRRKPANAGPLNSHALLVESLASMSRLSPDYLRRFIVHVQALQWLDQASAADAPPAKAGTRAKAGSARATRRK